MFTHRVRSFGDLDAMKGQGGRMMMSRCHVVGGETTVTDNDRQVLWQRTLQRPLDILTGKDAHTMHAVSLVSPIDAGQEAYRDVLVIAFTKELA